MYQTINIFPTTIYVGELENHLQYKKKFYDVDSEFNYRNSQWELQVKIHLILSFT